MRLQRLEISGFKSFSDPAELAFDRGVTAIVGPNGCGKSNLAEAITWVLGEQSAKSLRGDRMEDVIFSGSDARKPTGAAEVRLRLADVPTLPRRGNGHAGSNGDAAPADTDLSGGNGHGEEFVDLGARRVVELTRRLYRSGESEYLIDGEICRLRDIHDLLMDTGLGAKAYAIIEQGKIGMILSTRPTDRRQLIEEAAGVTKYKARRRSAELKLEASQQNLTRIDDIIFEVDKQRAALKRQAAKARRHRRLHDELQRWEKVLFARRSRELSVALESARDRLTRVRDEEAAGSAQLAASENDLGALRIRLAEAENTALRGREAVHACELDINRRQQQVELDRQQVGMLDARVGELDAQIRDLAAKQEPARRMLDERRLAAARAADERDGAAAIMAAAGEEQTAAQQAVEGLEGDVEAARSQVFAAINAATALRHALEHAGAAQERVGDTLSKLGVESAAVASELEAAVAEHAAAADALDRGRAALDATRASRMARDAERASARAEFERLSIERRASEHELTVLGARLESLKELDTARAGYTDAARMVLADRSGRIGALGSVADCLETDRQYERAVEACLGELLQFVLVRDHARAEAGAALVRDRQAGRCGFVVVEAAAKSEATPIPPAPHVVPLGSVVRLSGPHADAVRRAVGDAWIADDFKTALEASRRTLAPVATRQGDVFRGAHLVIAGGKDEGRGILATKREIRELEERLAAERAVGARLAESCAETERAVATAVAAIEVLVADEHEKEKAIVGLELRLARIVEDTERVSRRRDLLAAERRSAEEERHGLELRQAEARASIARLETDQRTADERLASAQRRLFEAREGIDGLNRRSAEAGAAHAALVERAAGLAADVQRLEEAAGELASRLAASTADRESADRRRHELADAIAEGQRAMDRAVAELGRIEAAAREAESAVVEIRTEAERQEIVIREARHRVDQVRASIAELDVVRARVEGDLAHLAATCLEAVALSLDAVVAEVEQLEAAGGAEPDARRIAAQDVEEDGEAEDGDGRPAEEPAAAVLTAEDAIADLRARINRLGPVNMMAIEQFDELDTRHVFLTTQRKDLVESIAATGEAIRRIDETTKDRFRAAFTAINANFQETFGTLFGGGRAGLMLIDENDLLETGIEIVAQPPGKRLQSVQLLSGGEKALAAIALMFAIFRYKPSPFCVLDEIDAPLDDANIGRFVEMLRSMQTDTQFILITHNRKTMEIADRLYGVTMEEPGVSKLISVELN